VASIAAQIARACETVGFFAIVNHGLEEKEEEESRSGSRCSVVGRAWTASREFFDLPLEEKLLCKSADEKVYPYGFECSERLNRGKKAATAAAETAAATRQPPPEKPPPEEEGGDGASADLKETFSIGPRHPGAGMPPRAFPARPPELRTALESYYEAMEGLASRLLRLFAMALQLPSEDWFEPLLTRHLSALRILDYREIQHAPADLSPSSNCSAPPLLVRAGEHTDYGALTILRSGGPGLQLRKDRAEDGDSGDAAGAWVDVPDIPGAFVVNIGDMMQRWTNGESSGKGPAPRQSST
jgi:isopenicillin N synthase-like dioxygenase